jgi:hypothetical protein
MLSRFPPTSRNAASTIVSTIVPTIVSTIVSTIVPTIVTYHGDDPRDESAAPIVCEMNNAFRRFIADHAQNLFATLNDIKELRKQNEDHAIEYLRRLEVELCNIPACNCPDYNGMGECCSSDCPIMLRTKLYYEIRRVIDYICEQKELAVSTEELKRGYFTDPCLKLLTPHVAYWISHWNVRFSEQFVAHYGLQGVLLPGRSNIRFVNGRLYFIIINDDESRITTFHELAADRPEFREKFTNEYDFVALVKLFSEEFNRN